MSMNGLRFGAIALVAGGALTGALLFSGALASAQTADETPTAEDTQETPADTTPSVTPQADQTPSDSTDTDKGTPSDATPPDGDGDHPMRDGECDHDGDGQPDAGMDGTTGPSGGTRFSGAGQRGGAMSQ